MKKLLLTLLSSVILSISIFAGEVANIVVIEKYQDSGLKTDGVARYTIRYISSSSLKKDGGGYILDEPREGSTSGLQYRGPIDRTVYWPDDFANINDVICKTNVGGKVYLYASPKPVESNDDILEKLKKRRIEE